LNCFPFSSDTKRMGIILRYRKNGLILFYLKGAEVILKNKIRPQQRDNFMLEKCETLSLEGLRTLVIAQKTLTQDEYDQWHEEYKTAKNDYERGD